MAHAQHAATDPYEPMHDNPHAHHGHYIVPASTLMVIFVALLALTGLTVGAAQAEAAFAHAFGVSIPVWVNVLVALSIAVVKTALVVGFFMQLRYDNPLNTMVFLFTVMCALCFFGFTITDLANRGTIERYKAQYIVPGGTGIPIAAAKKAEEKLGAPVSVTTNAPITKAAREIGIAEQNPYLQSLGGHGHGHDDHAAGSTPQRSRPVRGLTIGKDHGGDNSHGHDGHAAEPAKEASKPAGH